jgi:hypothetical protein
LSRIANLSIAKMWFFSRKCESQNRNCIWQNSRWRTILSAFLAVNAGYVRKFRLETVKIRSNWNEIGCCATCPWRIYDSRQSPSAFFVTNVAEFALATP